MHLGQKLGLGVIACFQGQVEWRVTISVGNGHQYNGVVVGVVLGHRGEHSLEVGSRHFSSSGEAVQQSSVDFRK